MTTVVHVAIADDWEAAANIGEYGVSTRGVSVDEAGYVAAVGPAGVQGVLDARYGDIRFAVVVVLLDREALEAGGVVVRADERGGFAIEGAIPLGGAEVLRVVPVERIGGRLRAPSVLD
ncbi:hypothetical protein [Herbiconiux sp. A18JL235]|uniref:DUF952 domain-containing protein n=1 Tax=Herbiconiux sp. A18JL235 TaxID=3152363 RepID=A0AB39BII3_9MICO